MEQHEALFEQYEDALFALWMERVAVSEGKKLLEENERLKNDPAAAIPGTTMRRCRQTIGRAFAKRSVTAVKRVGMRALHVAAIVVLICTVLMVTAVAMIPNARETLLNLVVEVLDTNTKFAFTPSENALPLNARWLPEGFELSDRGNDSMSTWKTYVFEDAYISVYICYGDNTAHSVDTENAYCEDLLIQGIPAQFTDNGYEQHVTILIEEEGKVVDVMGAGVSREDLIAVAENLTY